MTLNRKCLVVLAALFAALATPALAGDDLKQEQNLTVTPPKYYYGLPDDFNEYKELIFFFTDAFLKPILFENYGKPSDTNSLPIPHTHYIYEPNSANIGPVKDVVPVAGDLGPPIDMGPFPIM